MMGTYSRFLAAPNVRYCGGIGLTAWLIDRARQGFPGYGEFGLFVRKLSVRA